MQRLSLWKDVKLTVTEAFFTVRSPPLNTCRFITLCSSITPQQTAKQVFNLLLYECLCFIAALEQHNKYLTQQHLPLVKATQFKDAVKMLIQKPLTSWTWTAQYITNSKTGADIRCYLNDNSAFQSRRAYDTVREADLTQRLWVVRFLPLSTLHDIAELTSNESMFTGLTPGVSCLILPWKSQKNWDCQTPVKAANWYTT